MENISKILEEWGAWVANDQNAINLFNNNKKEFIPERIKLRKKCTHHDANIINDLMKRLMVHNKEDYQLLINYYVFGKTFIQLAKYDQCSDTYIGKKLKKAEGMIEGMLIFSGSN
ncbi:antiterminator Q family protein [Proteus columbae]|uniref:antiterminator Q family protein n=1 Tax=Proteus columbae TaxID=1987580 RepID=UPI0018C7AEF5|nr:antiterminator Q family protein [Proteus columbae]MBG6028850.1 antitermination protein [Proteus mirabilis]MBG6050132.1 antitermination protein [Proteus mirabilis]